MKTYLNEIAVIWIIILIAGSICFIKEANAQNFTGEWVFSSEPDCNPCGPMKLSQSNDFVTGNYVNSDSSRGVVSCYREGQVCRGAWANSHRHYGTFEWTISSDNRSFKGSYDFQGTRHSWNAKRK